MADTRKLTRPSPRATNPSRKAAILIASLPVDEAIRLTDKLDSMQLEKLANAIAVTHTIAEREQQSIATELVKSHPANGQALSEADLVAREHADAIARIDASAVAAILQDELAQTAATVLCRMSPAGAAAVLRRMTTDQQLAVVKRIAVANEGDPATVALLLHGIRQVAEMRSQSLRPVAGGTAFLAQVINFTGQATERALLENLAEEDRGLVDRLLQRMHVLRDSRRPIRDNKEPTARRRAG